MWGLRGFRQKFKRIRKCWRCGKEFVCYGDCKLGYRLLQKDYCTCPKCVAEEWGKTKNWEMCQVRRDEINDTTKEKVVFT